MAHIPRMQDAPSNSAQKAQLSDIVLLWGRGKKSLLKRLQQVFWILFLSSWGPSFNLRMLKNTLRASDYMDIPKAQAGQILAGQQTQKAVFEGSRLKLELQRKLRVLAPNISLQGLKSPTVGDRGMAPKDVFPGTCGNATLQGKGEL